MRYLSILLFTIIIQAMPAQVAETYAGKVVAITDGDTIKIITPEKKQIKVRLANIDSPEKSQPYGQKAKQVLSDKIFSKQVSVEKVTTDRYKRMIGKVYLGDRYINAEMVSDGYAWVYRKYNKDPHILELEEQAQEQRRGLWALQEDQRVPPPVGVAQAEKEKMTGVQITSNMNILTYNLRSGGKRKGETSWEKILEEFSPDLVFAQETFDPSSYLSPEKQFHPDDSIIWQPTSVGWGSTIYVRKNKLSPINIPNYEGWVVGGKIEGNSHWLASDKPLYVFSVHTPSPGPYDKKALSILDAIKEISGDNDLIIAGDFNITTAIRHPSEELKNSKLSIEFITRMREKLGLINSWQVISPNKNLPQTLRWSRNQDTPYHCDGIFIPLSWVRHIEQCTIPNTDYWKKMSAHNPILLKIKS